MFFACSFVNSFVSVCHLCKFGGYQQQCISSVLFCRQICLAFTCESSSIKTNVAWFFGVVVVGQVWNLSITLLLPWTMRCCHLCCLDLKCLLLHHQSSFLADLHWFWKKPMWRNYPSILFPLTSHHESGKVWQPNFIKLQHKTIWNCNEFCNDTKKTQENFFLFCNLQNNSLITHSNLLPIIFLAPKKRKSKKRLPDNNKRVFDLLNFMRFFVI
jgi:hypothetical protein